MRTRTRNALAVGALALALGAALVFVGRQEHAPPPGKSASARAVDAIPAGALLLATLDLDALRASTVAAPFLAPGREIQGVGKIKDICGFDPLDRMHDVAVAIPAAGDSGDFGLVATGDFSDDALIDCATKIIQKRGGQPVTVPMGGFRAVHDGASSGGGEIAVRRGGPLLLGAGAYLRAMIDTAEGRTPSVQGSVAHTALARAVGEGSMRLTFVLSPEQRKSLAADLDRAASVVAGGVAVVIGPMVKIHAVLECPSAEACADVARALNTAKEARANDVSLRLVGFGAMLERVAIQPEGALVHARIDVTADEAVKLVDTAVKLGGLRHPMPSGAPRGGDAPPPAGSASALAPPRSSAATEPAPRRSPPPPSSASPR